MRGNIHNTLEIWQSQKYCYHTASYQRIISLSLRHERKHTNTTGQLGADCNGMEKHLPSAFAYGRRGVQNDKSQTINANNCWAEFRHPSTKSNFIITRDIQTAIHEITRGYNGATTTRIAIPTRHRERKEILQTITP